MIPLLDTHALIWFAFDDLQLSLTAKSQIESADVVKEHLERDSIRLLPIELGHLALVSRLPLHHRDPFDRLITAQSITEGMAVVSADAALDAYGVTRLW